MGEPEETFGQLTQALALVPFTVREHAAARTSEEAARIRSTALASGAKAMLLVADGFLLAVVAAHRKLDWKRLKLLLQRKSVRMATEAEVLQVTHCWPGAVPPFGSLFGIPTYLDVSLREQGEDINFSAGLRTRSVCMKFSDYFSIENPVLGEFSKE